MSKKASYVNKKSMSMSTETDTLEGWGAAPQSCCRCREIISRDQSCHEIMRIADGQVRIDFAHENCVQGVAV